MHDLRTILCLAWIAFLAVPTTGNGGDMKTGYARVDGAKLYYEMKGSGPAVVFIHSGGFDRRIWDDQFSAFSDRYTVIRYDVRGYGKSPAPTKPYSDDDDLYRLLQFLRVQKAHLIGLSMGGRIAIDFTLTHPETVETLILAAPALSGFPYTAEDTIELMKIIYSIRNDDGTPAGEAWLRSAYNAAAMENPAVAARLRPVAVENSRSWLINIFFPRPPFPLAVQRLSDIHAPTLLIMGDRDVPTITKIVETIERNIHGSGKIIIRGAGHIVNAEKPEEFNGAVLDFLNRHRDSL